MITPIAKIDGLLAGITKEDLQRMPQVYRQRLAQALRHVADLADPPEPKPETPTAGVLADLRNGQRAG